MDQQLYELPDEWDWKCFSEICDNITDGAHASPKTVDEGKPYVTVRDVNAQGEIDLITCKKISDKDFKSLTKANCSPFSGDVLLSKDGTVGKVALVKENYIQFVVLSSLAIIRPNKNILNSEFLKNFLLSPGFQEYAINSKTGAAIKRIVLRNIKSFQIPLPPLPEQKRIVEKLDALLSRIDQAVNNLQESLGLAEALFASSLDGAFNPLGSIKNNESVFELPEGWEWKKLEDVITNTKNINPTSLPAQEWTYIDISSINRNKNTIEDPKIIIGKEAPSRAKKEVIVNDVLFATTRPNLKNIAFVDTEYNNPIASTGFCILRATEALNYKFLFYFLVTDIVQKQIEPFISGASYPAITDANLKRISFPLPPLSEQKRIVEKLDHLSIQNKDLKEKLQSQIDDLNALKASLLDAAFRGEL